MISYVQLLKKKKKFLLYWYFSVEAIQETMCSNQLSPQISASVNLEYSRPFISYDISK